MSYGEVPTLLAGDLDRAPEDTLIIALQKENKRLKEENGFLKHCLFLTKQNADLKTANVLANILSLLDGKLASPWDRLRIMYEETDDNVKRGSSASSLPNFQKSFNDQEVPSAAVPQNSFRPIVPERGFKSRDSWNLVTNVARVSRQPEVPPRPIPRNNTSIENDSLEPDEIVNSKRGDGPLKENISNANKNMESLEEKILSESGQFQPGNIKKNRNILSEKYLKQPSSANNSKCLTDDSWESMLRCEVIDSRNSKQKSTSGAGSGEFRRTSDDEVGSQVNKTSTRRQSTPARSPNTSVRKENVGSPVATSTPIRPSAPGPTDRDRHNSIISRPVDQIIGIVPKVTEEHFNKLSRISQNKRLVGEIAFQLDRRILEHVFGISLGVSSESSPRKKRRYYGFSVTNMGHMIRKVATNKNGEFDAKLELELRYRFDYVIRRLMKIGYNLDLHGEFSQDMVNKYGLMSGPPDQETAKEYGLDDPILLRILLSQLIENETELFNLLVLLDGLFLLSHDDKNPLYMW